MPHFFHEVAINTTFFYGGYPLIKKTTDQAWMVMHGKLMYFEPMNVVKVY